MYAQSICNYIVLICIIWPSCIDIFSLFSGVIPKFWVNTMSPCPLDFAEPSYNECVGMIGMRFLKA